MLASGHHRNGILLAPITAEAVAQQVLTGRPLPGTEPFGIDRFQLGEAAA
jgi:glycine oxidase